MKGEVKFKLPCIPSEPGRDLPITVAVKVGQSDSCVTIEQGRGPMVLVENQKGHMVVYVWKVRDSGDPVKVVCK
jgi:hypothetical protein